MKGKPNKHRLIALAAVAAAMVGCLALFEANVVSASQLRHGWDNIFGSSKVGPQADGSYLLPSNQWISPLGSRIEVTDGRLLSSTLSPAIGPSPAGTYLAALSWEDFTGFLTIIDVKTGTIVQQVGNVSPHLGDGTVGPDGPFYSPDGKWLWVSQSADVVRFAVDPTSGTVSSPLVIPLPLGGVGGAPLPAGMALSADGSKLYVALNGYNTLAVIDNPGATTPTLESAQIPVGNAPRQVVVVGNTAFVSNEGGRPATTSDFTNLSDGTPIVANPVTGGAVTGTVSVVNLTSQKQTASIPVGLEPSALCLDGSALFVANSNDDSVSIIDTASDKVTQTFNVNPVPGTTVGSDPNAIMMPDSSHVLVSIGRDNALAVYKYSGPTSTVRYQGLLPTDWYPVAVSKYAASGQLVITNDKGIGAWGPKSTISKGPGTNPATDHNTFDDTGSVTKVSWSSALAGLSSYTHRVWVNNGWYNLGPATPVRHSRATPVPVPLKLGQPSTIKHVFLIDRENRTYDQVFGDIKRGSGDASDTQFGAKVTPNGHALAARFGLFDNFYDPSTLSADGHNWLLQANANDYIEKQFGAFYRSYPALGADALAYQPNGFIWNTAKAAGKSVQDFGEYENFQNLPLTGYPTWSQWYRNALILEGKAKGPLPIPVDKYTSWSDIQSVNLMDYPNFPTFDLDIPDQYRADIWMQAFAQSVKTGNLPNLNLIALPDDHTAGLGIGDPYPVAEVADNDLALGRIVDKISHSSFWKSSVIFVVEDDSQNGVDHVDGHRAPALVISPWAKQGAVNSTYYTQLNVVKTIEQILGLAPMNQMDRAAQPMFNAFTDHPDFAPYTALPSMDLTTGVTGWTAPTTNSTLLRRLTSVPAAETAVEQQWVAWSLSPAQHLTG